MRVLVVEDELRMASLIRRGLTQEGLATDVAASGEDALWMAGAHDYDVMHWLILHDGAPPRLSRRGPAACVLWYFRS